MFHKKFHSDNKYEFWRFADRASQHIYLSNQQTWCTEFLFYNKFISCLYMFRAHVLIIRRSKLYYTASGIITHLGSSFVHETATHRCDDTRGCVMQFWPPDDEHMCSKHVEAWNKLIVKQKFCASSWLITEINKYEVQTDTKHRKQKCYIKMFLLKKNCKWDAE